MVRDGVSSTKEDGEDCNEDMVDSRVDASLERSANSIAVV